MTLLARRIAVRLALAIVATTPALASAQTIVDFDVDPAERSAMSTTMRMGGVFGGIRWDANSGWGAGAWNIPSLLNTLQCHSGSYCASPNGVGPNGTSFGAFSFLSPTRFFGLWLSGPVWVDARPIDAVGTVQNLVAAELWFGGNLVFTTPYLAVVPTPQFLDVRYAGPVDGVRLVGQAAATVVDDITFAAAPEPATFVLAGTGLALIVVMGRRRRA